MSFAPRENGNVNQSMRLRMAPRPIFGAEAGSLERISQPPKQDYEAGELYECEEVARESLVASDEPAKAHHPCKQALDVPSTPVATKRAAILGDAFPQRMMRSDHLDAHLFQLGIESVAVVSAVPDEAQRELLQESSAKGVLDERRFSSLTRRNPDGERKTIAVCHCHDLGRFAAASDPNIRAPLLAPAWVPSMNASVRSIFPLS